MRTDRYMVVRYRANWDSETREVIFRDLSEFDAETRAQGLFAAQTYPWAAYLVERQELSQ